MRLRRLVGSATASLALALASIAWAQTSVIVRKPDNSAAIDVANAANQTAPQAVAGSDAAKAVAVQGVTGGKPVKVDGSAVTQPVSAASLPLPTGAATSAAQATAQTSLSSIDTKLSSQATAANQATANGSLASIDGKTPSLGQAAKAASAPVTLPSDPDLRPASGTITAADAASSTVSGQAGVTLVTGSPTANSTQSWALNGHSSATLTATGTFSLAGAIETSADGGTTWAPATAKVLGYGGTSGTITAPGVFRVDVTGMTHVRVRATAYTSGTLTVQLAASASPGLTQILNPLGVRPAPATPLGYTQLTSLSAATGLGTIPTGTLYAVIVPESQIVRWRDDGTNPTASVGMELYPGQAMTYAGSFSALKVIEETASAKLNITFYK